MKLLDQDRFGAAVAWAEAEGEPYIAKLGVCNTIRHRMAMHYSSDGTVAGTVALRFQFSEFNDDRQDNARLLKMLELDDQDPVVKECMEAWAESATNDVVPGAVCYYSTTIAPPPWVPKMVFIRQLGNTRFYRLAAAGEVAA